MRSNSVTVLVLLLLVGTGMFPEAVVGQASPERVEYTRFGGATVVMPEGPGFHVGVFGGGLEGLERRRPDLAPVAARFRMQRRSGLALGALSLAAGAMAFTRYAGGSAPEIGDRDAVIYYGAMGLMAGAVIQLGAAQRSLWALANGGDEPAR